MVKVGVVATHRTADVHRSTIKIEEEEEEDAGPYKKEGGLILSLPV